ncbi:virulence-associated E family protein [Salisediminibacterium selenitireducens]|uniref:Virulence-associated E family protein n=1 Tax=Bacillus selenitireducens (strain ATCC 700615 / DSM 15326 / MLS10) TaxID=439292 RepID=D6XYZ4_BACIE|nr:virulence-associated E family protein [Salisediminibacterium selenitireducens]ADH98302.1 virulence-associated E family protein [[Bacillus] selenitireducens MLS10]
MRTLAIAYGNSRQTKKWVNKTITFEELKERLKKPIRTTESVEEYAKMSKAQKDDAKDHGGFVAGVLTGGRRKVDTVERRSMIALDGDRIDSNFLDTYEEKAPYSSVLYATHSSTDEQPRVRILFPLTRDVTPEEFVAVSRYLAQMLGIDQFDECSYLVNQLMYWPSMPADGTFLYKEVDKAWLDPDQLLAAHPEWTDPTQLPTSSRESKANAVTYQKVLDPLEKEGVVGLFNRVYFPVTKALDAFLSDVYEPTDDDSRYHFIESSSMAGVEIKEDGKFVYSHHAKDPAYLRLCNAFDIVRMHRFGDDNEKKSFQDMCDFAMKIDEVKVFAAHEKRLEAEADFSDEDDDWETRLIYKPRTNALENSVYNLNLILNHDPNFVHFAFNELANRIQVTGPLPWERPEGNVFWREADTAQLKSVLDIRYLSFSSRNHDVAFTKVADDRRFHPIRDYLNDLPEWDGVKRVEDLFITYLQADDTDYVRAVTRKTFAAAVARIYKPGTKFDSVPVLDGDQGIGKSTIVKDLVTPDFYSEALSLTDMDDKSGAEKLQGFWVVEIGELAGMKKADIEKVKAFLSTSDDKYRPSYGRVVESHPRQCIIIATVNGERGYLRDITGNRRFWIIKLHQKKQKKSWHFTEEFRQQFWAEAKAIWEAGEKLYLEGDVLEAAEQAQKGALEADERVGMVEEYLNVPLPADWANMDLFARRHYLSGSEFGEATRHGKIQRTSVSNAEIWCECFQRNLSELKTTDSYQIAALMAQISGWERTSTIKRLPIYGRQRLYDYQEP